MKTANLLLFINFRVILADLDLLPAAHRQVLACVEHVVTQYFDHCNPISLSVLQHTSSLNSRKLYNPSLGNMPIKDIIIEQISSGMNWPIIVWYDTSNIKVKTYKKIPREKTMNFLFVIYYEVDIYPVIIEFTKLINLYYFEKGIGGKGKMIIAFLQIKKIDEEFLFDVIISIAVKLKIYDVVLILPHSELWNIGNKSNPDISWLLVCDVYTWFPFRNALQCGKADQLFLIDTWIQDENGKFKSKRDLFPTKIPKQFDGCEAVFWKFSNDGKMADMEWFILHKIFASLNITLGLHNPGYTPAMDVMMLGGVSNLNSVVQNILENENQNTTIIHWAFTFAHVFSEVRWYVPCAEKNERHGNFYKVFDFTIWFLFFLSCILSAIVSFLIQKRISYEKEHRASLSYSFYCTLAVVSSVSVPKMPENPSLRSFFILWVCYALIISTIFQSFFTCFLIEPGMGKQISSLEEILASDLLLFADADKALAWFTEFGNFTEDSIEPMEIFTKTNDPIGDFFNVQKSAIVTTELDIKMKLQAYIRDLKPCSFLHSGNAFYSCVFDPLSSYYEAFHFEVMSYFEAGLITHMINSFTSSNSLSFQDIAHIKGKVFISDKSEYFIISTRHLNIVFFIYLFCNGVGVFVFLWEYFSCKSNLPFLNSKKERNEEL